MFIHVAVKALSKLDLVNRCLPRRNVALLALHFRVLPFQRVLAGGMVLDGKRRRIPSVERMARRALSPARPLRKLTAMRIRRVAIAALRKGQRLLEISALVARLARYFQMLPNQRIFCLRVVKLLAHRSRVDLLPTRRVMARLARPLEFSLVRICVTGVASIKRQSFVPRLAVRTRRVALLALHLHVRPGQWIARLRMIELRCLLPVDDVMTLQAILPQLSLMKILMARNAIGGQPQERPRNVLHLDLRTLAGRNMRRRMTFRAGNSRVLPFQLVPCLGVIKIVGIEAENSEVHTIMLGVAARTILRTRLLHNPRMVAATRRDSSSNLSMAIDALQRHRPAKLMAGGALRNAIE